MKFIKAQLWTCKDETAVHSLAADTRFKIIFASDTLSATVLKSRGLGVEMSSRANRTAAMIE